MAGPRPGRWTRSSPGPAAAASVPLVPLWRVASHPGSVAAHGSELALFMGR